MAARKKSEADKKVEEIDELQGLSLEEAFAELQETVNRLEDETITLEASFQSYEHGMRVLRYCSEKIDQVEKKVLKLNEAGELDEF